jgi:hypothetical protein
MPQRSSTRRLPDDATVGPDEPISNLARTAPFDSTPRATVRFRIARDNLIRIRLAHDWRAPPFLCGDVA